MKRDTKPTVIQEREVPEAIRSLSTLARIDYVDVFTVLTGAAADRSPDEWARSGLDDAAGLAGQFIWRKVLGLRLERRSSPNHVAGWNIVDWGESWIVLEAASWFLTAQIVVQVGDGQVSVATLIQYDRRIAAVVWPRLSVVHRAAMPGLLRHAANDRSAEVR